MPRARVTAPAAPVAPVAAPARALFVSDVHLSAAHPETVAAFFRFLERARNERLDALYVLGDLFDFWAGDDDLGEALNRRVADELAVFARTGVAIALMTGNRDLLLGPRFAGVVGARLLPDPSVISVAGRAYLLSHGDTLCTDDEPYQAFRETVRNPAWQKDFLARPLAERRATIAGFRTASEAAKSTKSEAIMDVNGEAVRQLLLEHAGTVLIHGHTHRPGREALTIMGALRERWVLPDWDARAEPPRGGGLLADAAGLAWVGAATAGSWGG